MSSSSAAPAVTSSATKPGMRLFLDETGDHNCSPKTTGVGAQYLGLTGVVFPFGASYLAFGERLEELKTKYCPDHDPDDGPIILHRKEIIAGTGPFTRLANPEVREEFNEDLLEIIRTADFRWITVVIDKVSHQKKHYRDLKHPYHYGLHAMLERYCYLLGRAGVTGDVLAEGRGNVEDGELKKAYRDVHQNGTVGGHLVAARAQERLSSGQLKIRKKEANVPGLQLADLLAFTLTRDVLRAYGLMSGLTGFGKALGDAVERKCLRNYFGVSKGWGRKLLL